MRNRRTTRGSALITVVLVVLILTIIGIGIAYFTSVEDRMSGNTRIQKAAFYAADSGLRKGEALISGVVGNNISMGALLTYDGSVPALKVPGGGYDAVILRCADVTGAKTVQDFNDIAISLAGSVVDKAFYSLYIRNNVEDIAGSATVDGDSVINLVSVGKIRFSNGNEMTQILEEQLVVSSTGTDTGSQKGANSGGTGSGSKR
jgi:hypothetical protein